MPRVKQNCSGFDKNNFTLGFQPGSYVPQPVSVGYLPGCKVEYIGGFFHRGSIVVGFKQNPPFTAMFANEQPVSQVDQIYGESRF
jgi:hypothetical protein